MGSNLDKYPNLIETLENNKIVYIFGTGISSSLTGVPYGWYRWIEDGINSLSDTGYSEELKKQLDSDSSPDNMISVVSKLIDFAKSEASYEGWMKKSFETNTITNFQLASTLSKILMTQDILVTTNYDLLLEKATGLEAVSYEEPNIIFPMIDKNLSTHVIHLHGVYDSAKAIDNIIADETQYSNIYNNDGAQFIQNLLGTRTLIFVGCGQTTEDINIARFIKFAKEHLKLNVPYYFLHQSNAKLPEMPDNIITIEYGDNHKDLPIFLEGMIQYRIKNFLKNHPIIGRTIYEKEKLISSGMLNYHFAQQSIEFQGREEELKDLNAFLKDDSLYLWWAITGQAGSGKSRLAYELMKRNKINWFSFFLNDSVSASEAKKLIPFCNTMVVIDYVKGKESKIAEIVKQLINSFQQASYKLRILFLERENSTVSGSWYDLLTRSLGKYNREQFEKMVYIRSGSEDIVKNSKVLSDLHNFVYLEDLDNNAVVSIIRDICRKQGLPQDNVRDIRLKEEYEKKFEQLKYRPLFIQIYVEAWIENDCKHPRYDGFEGLLERVLQKEQERWISNVDGDMEYVNALIRVLVRACAGSGLDIQDMPELYQGDWDKLQNFVKNQSLPGEQRKHSLEIFLSDICQSLDKSNSIILPLYPDIIKEYMFAYYTDESELLAVCEELWDNAGNEFSTFLYRCITDFRDNELFIRCIEEAPNGLIDVNVMMARRAFLNRKVIQPKDDINNMLGRIEKEYTYWNSVIVGENTDISIALAKFNGLSMVASQYGAWMYIDKMMECIREALAIPGGEVLNIIKGIALSDRISQLSQYGYLKEAKELQLEIQRLSRDNVEDELIALVAIQSINAEMMAHLFQGDFYKAFGILESIEKQFNKNYCEQVEMYAHSCFNMAQFSMMENKSFYIQKSLQKLQSLYKDYSENEVVKAFYLKGRMQDIQNRYFRSELSKEQEKSIKKETKYILSEVNSSKMCSELAETWAMVQLFMMNFADGNNPELIEEMLIEAELLLNEFPNADMVAQTYIRILHAVNKEFYKIKVKKSQVEKAFAYVQRYPESESIREAFFDMLNDSDEKENIQRYETKPVVSEAMNHLLKNPGGNEEYDDLEYLFNELGYLNYKEDRESEKPYVRATPKVGRNEPCPCGSGKKYKKCCGR